MAKPGPKSKEGKAIVSLNAVKHGVLSASPVIPGLEREEDWEVHRAGVLASLAPEGHLEMALAERVALQLWRLRRVARYETESIVLAQERVDDGISRRRAALGGLNTNRLSPLFHGDLETELGFARESVRLLEGLTQLPDEASLPGEEAATILSEVASVTEDVDPDDFSFPGVPDDAALEDFTGWTAHLVREGIAALAAHAEVDPKTLLAAANARAKMVVVTKEFEAEQKAKDLDHMRRERLLPEAGTLEKIVRYEAHLNRQLYQALHELEALQTRRLGGIAPLARVDVQGLPEK